MPTISSLGLAIEIPDEAKQGDPVKASDFNLLRTALLALAREIRSVAIIESPDIGFKRTAGGTSLFVKARGISQGSFGMFDVRAVKKQPADGDTPAKWVCYLEPGMVLHTTCGVESEIMNYIVPDGMSDIPYEAHEIGDDKVIGVRIHTDYFDLPTSVAIEVKASGSWTNIHAVPPTHETGGSAPPPRNGDYFYKLHKFTSDTSSGTEVIKIDTTYHSGPLLHVQNIQECYNRILPSGEDGTAYEIYAQWDSASRRHEFRGIVQITSPSGTDTSAEIVPIIKPYDGEATHQVIRWRGLVGRTDAESGEDAVTRQIKVQATESGAAIEIIGNGKKGYLIFTDCTNAETGRIEWDDGLITNSGEQTIKAGCPSPPTC